MRENRGWRVGGAVQGKVCVCVCVGGGGGGEGGGEGLGEAGKETGEGRVKSNILTNLSSKFVDNLDLDERFFWQFQQKVVHLAPLAGAAVVLLAVPLVNVRLLRMVNDGNRAE